MFVAPACMTRLGNAIVIYKEMVSHYLASSRVYKLALKQCDRLYLSEFNIDKKCQTKFG